MAAADTRSVHENLGMLESEAERNTLIAAHARWDATDSDDLLDWVTLAQELPGHDAILRERLQRDPEGPAFGYAALRRGQLDQAFALAETASPPQPRLALMVGASDGAKPSAVAAALKAQARLALDVDNAWMAIGLAIKSGKKTDPLLAAFSRLPADEASALRNFVASLEAARDPQREPQRASAAFQDAARLEALLQGVSPQVRAQAYGIGLIAWGQRAPAPWRSFAKRALLPAERPYFS